jgi:hypothetical protein
MFGHDINCMSMLGHEEGFLMFSFRGDAHKFYLKLKKTIRNGAPVSRLKEMKEIGEIRQFYQQLNCPELTNIRYRMLKEKSGNGIVPILISALPWLGFLVSKQLQSLLTKGNAIVFLFLTTYTVLTTVSVVIHYREKAWTTVHIEIIKDVIKEKDDKT